MSLQFPDIEPVALALGPLDIRWYSLAYLAGFLLGWWYMRTLASLDKDRASKNKYISKIDIDDFLPWVILGVILGGRIGYVLFYQFDSYRADPLEILKVWHGGMSFHGGALGATLSMIIYAYRRKLSLLRLSDMVACAVPLGLFFGRLANFVNGELFGRATNVPWAMAFPRGGDVLRHPSQIYEALLEGALLFVVLAVLVRMNAVRGRSGVLSGLFLIGYATVRVFIELFREPDIQLGFIAGHFTMGQMLSAPMIIGGLSLVFYSWRRGYES